MFYNRPCVNRKTFKRYPRASANHFVCMCVLSLYTLYMSVMLRHGGGVGRRQSTAEQRKTEKVGGILISFISKNRLKSLIFKATA